MIARVYNKGRLVTIWVLYINNKCQPVNFLRKLDAINRRKITAYLDRVVEKGPPNNKEKFRRLDHSVFEFKSGGIRLLCFEVEGGYIITKILKKPQKKILNLEIMKLVKQMELFRKGGYFDE